MFFFLHVILPVFFNILMQLIFMKFMNKAYLLVWVCYARVVIFFKLILIYEITLVTDLDKLVG